MTGPRKSPFIYGCELSAAIKQLGRPMTYYPNLAKIIGLHESIFLCQIMYWSPRGNSDEGWIYKSAEELEAETGLSYKQQIRVRKVLTKRGVLEEKYDRQDHRLFFRISLSKFDEIGEHITFEHMLEGKMPGYQRSDATLPKVRSYKEAEITTESTQKEKPVVSDEAPFLLDQPEKPQDPIPNVFAYFVEAAEKTTSYTLTEKRHRMAEKRWKEHEQHQLALGTPKEKLREFVSRSFRAVIDELVSSPYHKQNGYVEWEQLFRSTEAFEKWLDRYSTGYSDHQVQQLSKKRRA